MQVSTSYGGRAEERMTDDLVGDAVVRVANAHDVAVIAELRSEWTGVDADEPDFAKRVAVWFEEEKQQRTIWLAWERSRAVGMVSLVEFRRMPTPGKPDTCWGYVGHMFVRADARDRGIGAELMAALINTADERGYVRLLLSPSERAVPFFRRAGFRAAGPDSDTRFLVRHRHTP
jgi:GNAT superfamily N-acetyltransferase